MRLIYRSIVILISFFVTFSSNAQTSNSKKVKKLLLQEFKDFVHIPTQKHTVEYGVKIKFASNKDDHALAGARQYEQFVETKEFFMNNHEVTNQEYLAFVNFYKQQMIHAGTYDTNVIDHPVLYSSNDGSFVNFNIQVQSKLWVNEISSHMGDPMQNYYFKHADFINYPVVAISYEQCLSFIKWKNEQLIIKLKSLGFNESWGEYKIPSRVEWMSASNMDFRLKGLDENQTQHRIYPWDGHSLHQDKKATYRANFGNIIDENGFYVNNMYDDGYNYTAPVKNYELNEFGLYDMAGNVSEWTSTTVSYDSIKTAYSKFYELIRLKYDTVFYNEINKLYPNWNKIDSLVKIKESQNKVNDSIWFNPLNDQQQIRLSNIVYNIKEDKPMETHNLELVSKTGEVNVVKGGDWWRGPSYLQTYSEQGYYKKEASITVGFRLALDLDPKIKVLLGEKFVNRK